MTFKTVLRRISPVLKRSTLSPKVISRNVLIKTTPHFGLNVLWPLTTSNHNRWLSNSQHSQPNSIELDNITYERVCSETLESLCDYFEELVEDSDHLKSADVSYGSGVLTVNFGGQIGTYVINRQSPNKQIWLSSPSSGPKRFDFVIYELPDKGKWIYKHTGESLHELLQQEVKVITKKDVDFFSLPYSHI